MTKTIMTKPNNALRRARIRAGMTQLELSRLAKIPEATLARIDGNPAAKISIVQAAALARALNCDLYDLLP